MMRRLFLLACTLLALAVAADPLERVQELPVTVLRRLPHDPAIWTQGFAFYGDTLFESSGLYRESRLLSRPLESVTPERQLKLPRTWFAEGLAIIGDAAYLLTWHEGIAQRYRLPDLRPEGQFRYKGEGWGLTSDGEALIMSDGSSALVWRNPRNFKEQRRLEVRATGEPITRLNELEWADGWILANVWLRDWVVGIDPRSGEVAWKFSVAELLSDAERRRADVANGIAWHPASRRLYVTGKRWPHIFEIAVDWPAIESN